MELSKAKKVFLLAILCLPFFSNFSASASSSDAEKWVISPQKFSGKSEYQEPTISIVQRKLRWTWEQVSEMVKIPVGMSEKQWNKLSFKDKVRLHAQRCMMEGEEKVDIEYVY